MQAADYTQQLAAIVTALRQPPSWWTNPWVLATFSTFLGVIGGFLGQLLLKVYADRQARQGLLKMWYLYTGSVLAVLDTLMSASPDSRCHQLALLSLNLPTAPEEYTNAHRAIYVELPQSPSFDVIFKASKALENPPDEYDRVNVVLQIIVQEFVAKRLTLRDVAKYRNKEETASFTEMLSRYGKKLPDVPPTPVPS